MAASAIPITAWRQALMKHPVFGWLATKGFIEFLAAEEILAVADARPSATHLRIDLDENSIEISVLKR